LNEIRKLAFKD